MQRLSAITHAGFGLFRVRSPLLTESRLFSFPVGTEMFHFPTFPPTTLCVQVEVAGHYSGFFRGFPIRKSTDQSSFTSSPWLIAGYNVLHRLLMPRHPPIALSSLSPNQNDQQQKIYLKMLASTIQFSNNNPNQTKHPHKHGHPARPGQQRNPQPHSTHQNSMQRTAGNFRTQQRAHPTPHPPQPTFHTHQNEQY